jgi:hypothetical protein
VISVRDLERRFGGFRQPRNRKRKRNLVCIPPINANRQRQAVW